MAKAFANLAHKQFLGHPGHRSSRPGTGTKTFMFLGFRTQHINFWPLATGRETPPHPVGRPPPRPGSHRKDLFMFMCLFLSWALTPPPSQQAKWWNSSWISIGDHQPHATSTNGFRSKSGILGGWCSNCQNLREEQNIHHPQDCTSDVQDGFCGGGVRIVGFNF